MDNYVVFQKKLTKISHRDFGFFLIFYKYSSNRMSIRSVIQFDLESFVEKQGFLCFLELFGIQ